MARTARLAPGAAPQGLRTADVARGRVGAGEDTSPAPRRSPQRRSYVVANPWQEGLDSTPGWRDPLPHREYDAVLTATALHWLPAERLAALYAELRDLLRPGGLLVNADHMPDDTLPDLTKRLLDRARTWREARYAAGAVPSWSQWWELAAADRALAPLVAERHRIYPTGHSPEWNPPVSWHLAALTEAGFTEVGTVWRGGADAAVAGVR
ncbi:class I SAM-dependent methyltransferase [Micromonospora sp. H33]|uniref:class I SAM-dependent methyltransferase n=1 Tax=Micromonospora sp. H33 TaxID=3452215 RepID=UPI003F8C7D6D